MWEFYRFDFSSSGATGVTPSNSWQWNLGKQGWVKRIADAPIDVSDAELPLLIQTDTSSTDLGVNNSTNTDINLVACAVNFASTATLGGRFDNASSGYYTEIKALPDGLINSQAITSCPPMFKLRYDNNTTLAGYCTVLVSFRRKYQ